MNTDTALAVLFAVLSAVGYAAGAVAQERLASRAGHTGAAAGGRGFGWWVALGGNGAGALLHVLALRYGVLTVVQPLGALTLVFALPLGALAINRRVRRAEWLGAGLTVTGLAVLLALVPAGADPGVLGSGQTYGVTAVVAAAAAGLVWWARSVERTGLRALLYGVAAGTSFALASVLTQAVAVGWAERGWAVLLGPVPVLLAVAATGGVWLSQLAYRGAGLAVPLTAVTLANPAAAAVIGLVLLGEGFVGGATGVLVAVAAAAVTVRGVLLLTGHDDGGALVGAPAGVATGTDPAGVARVAGVATGDDAAGVGWAAAGSPVRPEPVRVLVPAGR